MQPENRIKACYFWELHVAIASNTIVNAIMDCLDVVGNTPLTARPCTREIRVVRHGREQLVRQ